MINIKALQLENQITYNLREFQLSDLQNQNILIDKLIKLLFDYTFIKHSITEYFVIIFYWFVFILMYVGTKAVYYLVEFYKYLKSIGDKNV